MIGLITLNGTTLPDPLADGGITITDAALGSSKRMADGALRADIITRKSQIQLRFDGLSLAERDALLAVFLTYNAAGLALVLPDGQTFTVQPAIASWAETQTYFGARAVGFPLYGVNFTLEEV